MHVDDGMAPRRRRGQRANWSAQGRVVCHQLATSIMRLGRGRYREAYDRKKAEYAARPRLGPVRLPILGRPTGLVRARSSGAGSCICMDTEGAIWTPAILGGKTVCARVRDGGEILERIELDDFCFSCMLGGDDGSSLFMLVATWRGMDRMGELFSLRSGRVLVTQGPAPHAGRPEEPGRRNNEDEAIPAQHLPARRAATARCDGAHRLRCGGSTCDASHTSAIDSPPAYV